jgi:hypothetical protein
MRRLVTAALISTTLLVGAAHPALAAPVTVSDPLGDVLSNTGAVFDRPGLDIVSATAELTRTVLTVTTVTAAPPGGQLSHVYIDLDGGLPEFMVLHGVLWTYGPGTELDCPLLTRTVTGTQTTVTLPTDCIGSPTAIESVDLTELILFPKPFEGSWVISDGAQIMHLSVEDKKDKGKKDKDKDKKDKDKDKKDKDKKDKDKDKKDKDKKDKDKKDKDKKDS